MALTTVKSEQIQSSVALAGSPTTTTQSASDNSTKIATTAYADTAVANLVASAPTALNTLDELAAALNDDASFSTTVTNSIATKLPLAGGTMTGALVGTTATFAGGAANNNDDANILTLNASQHARLLVDTSSTGGHRATLALESNGNELTLSTTGSASYLTSVGNLEISGGNVGIGVTSPGAVLSLPAGESNTPRFAIESAVDANDFTITQYEDGNGTYTMLGQNVKLNSGGNNTVLDSAHRTAGIVLDARNHGAITFITGAANTATEHVKIDSSSKTGIGTTVLNKIFNIADPAQGGETLKLHFEAESSNDKWAMYSYDRTNGHYADLSFGANYLYLKSGGDVGVATSDPAAKLHVMSGDLFLTANSTAANSGQGVYFQSTTNGWNTPAAHAAIFGKRTDASNGYLRFDTRKSGTTREVMRLLNTGELVLKNTTAAPTNSASLPGSLTFEGFGWDSNYGSKPIRAKIVHSASYGDHGSGATQGALIFYLKGAGGLDDSSDSLLEGMRLDAGGAYHTGHPNLGINTSNIFNSLHVRGDVGQEPEDRFSVSGGGSTDYIDLYKVHGNYIRGSGRLRAMGTENNLNVGYVEYFYAYSRSGGGTYYINIKLVDEAYVNNTYARPRFYLTNSSSYNTGTNRQTTNQTANSTNTNILRVSMSNQANAYGTFQFAVEPFHWHQ